MYIKPCWGILLIERNSFLNLLLLCVSSQKPLWRRLGEKKVGWAIKQCHVSYKCVSFPGTVTTSHHSSSYKSKSSSTVTSTSGHSSGSSSGAVAYRQQRPGAHFQQQQPLNLSQVSQLSQDWFWWCIIQLLTTSPPSWSVLFQTSDSWTPCWVWSICFYLTADLDLPAQAAEVVQITHPWVGWGYSSCVFWSLMV